MLLLLLGVPNYPPPSFQEAVGTPLLSSSMTSQSSSLPASLDMTGRRPVERQHDMSESESSMSQGSPSETPSASESEDSLEIIETVHPPGLSTREQENGSRGRQGIEFPCPSPSVGSTTCVNASISPLSESGLPRGRAKTKLKSVLDLTEDIPEPEPEPSPVRSTKKRFLSLSPLRTLFPPKHQALQVRALSAHPSPGTSPYATPRSTHFFRSTTSLASSSVLRLPFAGSTLTLTANKPESAKPSKKFFHSKEKEREREHDECSSESLDSWEFLESEDSRRIDNEPRSLMAMIAPVPDSPSPVLSSELSPARSLSFTYGAPPTPTTHSPLSPMISQPVSAPAQTQPTTTSWNEPHPLSLRDRKVAEAIEPFLRRRPRRDGTHHRSRTTPNPIVAVPPIPPGAGPPVTTVRTRMNPSNHQNNQSTVNADMTVCPTSERCESITASGGGDSTVRINDNTHDFQRALETPLPSSPVRPLLSSPHTKGTSAQSSPSPVMINISSPTTPIPARGGAALDVEEGDGVQPSPVPTPKAAKMLDTPIQRPTTIGCVCKHSPTAKALAPIQDNSASSLHPSSSHSQRPLVESTMSSSPSQAGRRHYPGRPLPRPPQPQPPRNVVVDSIYAGHEAFQSQTSGSPNTTCPEGLLIDLENDEDPNVSGAWTPPMDDHSHQLYPPSGPATPNRSSPIGSSSSTPDPSIRSLPLSFSSGNVSSLSGLSEMTDLDLLAAALGDGNNGADYEVGTHSDLGLSPPHGLMCTLLDIGTHFRLFRTC